MSETKKRERTRTFTLPDVQAIRDRMHERLQELNGFVQQMEKVQEQAPDLKLTFDGGERIHDAEREIIKWLARISGELRVQAIPAPRVGDNGHDEPRPKRRK